MTSTQLAREECSNFNPDGTCLGMDITDDGSMKPLWNKSPRRCVLLDNMPCRFYEECLLAGIPMISSEKKADAWQEAADEYNEKRSENEYEQRHSEDGLVGRGNPTTSGMHEETPAETDPAGRRYPFCAAGARVIRLPGLRCAQVDRGTQIQSRLTRNRC